MAEKICKIFNDINFRWSKGNVDIFYNKELHDYYELYLFINGNTEFINTHTRRKLEPYQLVIIPAGEYHQFSVVDDIPNYERSVFHFNQELFSENNLKEAFHGKDSISLSPDHRIVQNFFYLRECMDKISNRDYEPLLKAVLTDIIIQIKQFAQTESSATDNLRKTAVDIMDYINTQYCEHITLEAIAKHFFLSVSTICHIFRQAYNISIKHYILQKRLNSAALALSKGENPQQVCANYGFSNYSAFYRAFVKRFGVSPSKYNKNTN